MQDFWRFCTGVDYNNELKTQTDRKKWGENAYEKWTHFSDRK